MSLEFVEPEWDSKYLQMLDALIEYLEKIGEREDTRIDQRDITIIRALVEFYDFEVEDNQDLLDIMDDVKARAKELDLDVDEE